MPMQALPTTVATYYTLTGLQIVPLEVKFGTTGAITSWRGKFFTNIVRNGAGQYTLTLDHQFLAFMGFTGVCWKLAGATTPLTPVVDSTSLDGVTGNTIVIDMKSGSTNTDPASGDELFLWFAWNATQTAARL